MPPKEPEQTFWIKVADRYGPVSAVLVFVGIVIWYAGGWVGNEILKPALAAHVKYLDTSTEIMRDQAAMLKANSDNIKVVMDYEARQVRVLESIEKSLIERKTP